MPVIPLKAYRVAPRKPWLAIEGGEVRLKVPAWFGGATFATPVSNVGVVDPALAQPSPEVDDVVFEEPLVLPYLYTTGPATAPNVGLVFAEPVRTPGLRWLVLSQLSEDLPKRPERDGRPAGRYVDGVMLRAEDPAAAVEALAAAGAERVTAPDAWLAARRRQVTDPDVIADREAAGRRFTWTARSGLALFAGGIGAAIASERWGSPTVSDVALAVGLAGGAVHQVATYLDNRFWFRPRGEGRRRRRGGAAGE